MKYHTLTVPFTCASFMLLRWTSLFTCSLTERLVDVKVVVEVDVVVVLVTLLVLLVVVLEPLSRTSGR